MAVKLTLLLFGLAVASAIPQGLESEKINWPDRPFWWPDRYEWPPQWPNQPSWWPDSLPWPPARPEEWPDQPSWWPDSLPWPPARPEGWPDQPSWWPDSLPWPPARPEQWPDQPSWWPDSLPWPPARPEGWPDQPSWWPDSLPWPPAKPEEWPDQPSWWPDSLPWPPARPEEWPDRPTWWPESFPWPPQRPEISWPPQLPDWFPLDIIPYIPSRDNQYHLFTRANPSVSQPLVMGTDYLLTGSNYNSNRKTVVLIHDFQGSAVGISNAILVPAILSASDSNVIVVDWSAGADSGPLISAIYSALSGNHVARFLNWLSDFTNGDLANYHLVGVGLGGLNAGLVGRRLKAKVGYITALDPSGGPSITNILPPLNPSVAGYTEVIHTDVAQGGYAPPLGDVDFYPNGGSYMPGCGGLSYCNRNRAVYFFAESIQSGGFTGVECASFRDALAGDCNGAGRLNMGGLEPKPGARGVYYLQTNAEPPFSKG